MAWNKKGNLVGPQGPQGPQGPTGPQGEVGPQGPTGPTGATGPKGATGEQGPQGIQGPAGKDGAGVNILGSKDSASALPSTGSAGDAWLVNGYLYVWDVTKKNWSNVGNIQGPQGIQGPAGAAGAVGPQGPQGETGATGPQGPKGETGATGPQGPIGETGPQGPTGATGKGVKSAAVTYQVGTSGTTVPTGSWVAAVPAVSQGQFLWSRTIVTYPDSTTSTVYSVSYYAKDGARGETGATGETGSAGSTILTGATAPTSTQGKVGDIFIQTNGDWYVKE